MAEAKKKKLLLVEDDSDIRLVLAELLREHGYDVIEAWDGRTALARLEANPDVGLIVLDLLMPDMNGWEFREAQLRNASTAPIPVVAMSAGGTQNFGGDVLLHKPFDVDVLIEAVRKHCR
jgi:CheY-like chemotaxis protein